MGANQTWAKVIGVVLLLVGLLGFFMTSPLLGMFEVNMMHNLVHLVSGAIFAWAGFAAAPTKKVNTWLGVIYLLVGILGIFGLMGFLNVNTADNWLHIVIGAVSALI